MIYYGKPEFEIRQQADYYHVVCTKCQEACELDYKGDDSAVPLIQITCPKCGTTGPTKLHMGGHGFGEARRRIESAIDSVRSEMKKLKL